MRGRGTLSCVCVILLQTFVACVTGLNPETHGYCCDLGTNYANSGLECQHSAQTPIPNIQREDQTKCVHLIELCCKKQNRELQCNKGIADAQSKGSCDAGPGVEKECCDACQLGLDSGNSKQPCEDSLGLGAPYDAALIGCCKDATTNATVATTSTTVSQTTPSQAAIAPLNNKLQSAPPPIENVCDIGDVCAQICIPTGDSYKCACNKGFSLMGDGVSCKPDKRSNRNKGDRCAMNNPCDHECIDTGVAIKCSCRDGYELADDKRTCKDIDECATGTHMCEPNEVCSNDEGAYYCDDPNFLEGDEDVENKCPTGYKFNYEKLVCDDIDECQFDIICPRPKTCINTIGSFKCEGEDRPQCPPGFHYKPSIDTCDDIDECLSGENDCNKESQVCLNTKGNYTCVDKVSKKSCPPGFKKNADTQNCDDVNECEENEHTCEDHEECVNEPGGHSCTPKRNTQKKHDFPLKPPEEPKLPPKPTEGTSAKPATTTAKLASCPRGFKIMPNGQCGDIDECQDDDNACDSTQYCYNTPGSYVCNCKPGFSKDYQTGACIDVNECQLDTHDCTFAQRCDNTIGSYICARITGCGTGYTLNYANGLCEDDDECALGTHNCNDLSQDLKCRNTLGSFRCERKRPQYPLARPSQPNFVTPAYVTPKFATPTFATPTFVTPAYVTPSFVTPRTTFPPQTPAITRLWTKPSVASQSPAFVQTPFVTKNYPILSGTLKRCLPGYFMNERGVCEDINECDSNPCTKGQKCLNFNGRYQCISAVQCKIGYQLDDSGENCVDVNECTRGTHKCSQSQICKNGNGFYTCECLPGHHINPNTQTCEDIDECKYYRPCSNNAECVNTVGSFQCLCKGGFRTRGNLCEDIDECKDTPRLCEHSCVNVWGGYRCACKPGFTLNYDNRTCTDIDECEKFKDKRLCIGNCENVPGSYKCVCPKGYRLSNDGRICNDIDECQQNVCRPGDICLNTRGSYKCYAINCPANYFRDSQHKGRCKRPETLCDPRDFQCILMPQQYTYHYITLVSNLPINENIQFFQINGPRRLIGRAEFTMKVVKVDAPPNVIPAHQGYFKMEKLPQNIMHLYIVRSIQGPQEIQLQVEMELFGENEMTGKMVAYIFIVVSEYEY